MFENLSLQINKIIKGLQGKERIDEENIAGALKQIRRALVAADVHFKLAKELTQSIKAEALGQELHLKVSPGEFFTTLVLDELTRFMGSSKQELKLEGDPAVVLVAGLQGAGKTTFVGKLAHRFKKEGKKPLLVACDIYRPAAITQLQTLGSQIDLPVYADTDSKDPLKIAAKALEQAKEAGHDVVIVDTAGRLSVDEAMMEEVAALKASLKPSETLFVVDAMMGQAAVDIAASFNERLDFDGIVLTKMDGDTRGGAAISVKKVTDKPIKLVSTGEKMEDLEDFHPDRISKRILGMGDVVSLVEKAQEVFDEEEARQIKKRIHEERFDYNDFRTQIRALKKLGSLETIMDKLPGNIPKFSAASGDEMLRGFEIIIASMTPGEREARHTLTPARKRRIAAGSGRPLSDVNKLCKHFFDIVKMMKKKGNDLHSLNG